MLISAYFGLIFGYFGLKNKAKISQNKIKISQNESFCLFLRILALFWLILALFWLIFAFFVLWLNFWFILVYACPCLAMGSGNTEFWATLHRPAGWLAGWPVCPSLGTGFPPGLAPTLADDEMG